MTKNEIYEYLESLGIEFELFEHEAVCNMAELENIALPHPECEAKNLFIRDEKKRNYYLISVKGDKRIDLKEFRRKNNTKPLSFASEEDLKNMLGLTPGSVTPLGLLCDEERKVHLFLDSDFLNGIIGIHPNDNTATIYLKTEDLVKVIERHGNEVSFVSL